MLCEMLVRRWQNADAGARGCGTRYFVCVAVAAEPLGSGDPTQRAKSGYLGSTLQTLTLALRVVQALSLFLGALVVVSPTAIRSHPFLARGL